MTSFMDDKDWCASCNGTGGDMFRSCSDCSGRGWNPKYPKRVVVREVNSGKVEKSIIKENNNMTTIKTYNNLKKFVRPDRFEHVLNLFRRFEEAGLIDGGKDYGYEQLQLFYDYIVLPTIKYSTIIDPVEYEDKFDGLIEDLLYDLCRIKGLDSISIKSEMLSNIREQIVDIVHSHGYDLSSPQKEYKLGDKVSIYYEGTPQEAKIVCLGSEETHALLLNDFRIIYVKDIDTPTNYIIELQKIINIE